MSKEDRILKRRERKEGRKPFKDTAVGVFLKEKAPDILGGAVSTVGDVFSIGGLNMIGEAIAGSNDLSESDKEHALNLLDYEIKELEEITKRWEADAKSESWLPKNIRPLTLAFLMLFMSVIVISDSIEVWSFDVKDGYITLIEALLLTTVIAYMGSRGAEKVLKDRKK
jgi:hypothetical protein